MKAGVSFAALVMAAVQASTDVGRWSYSTETETLMFENKETVANDGNAKVKWTMKTDKTWKNFWRGHEF